MNIFYNRKKKISKCVLLLLLFLLRKQQSLVNSIRFSCQKHQIAHTSVELSVVFSLIVNRCYISQHSNCCVRVREVGFRIRWFSQSDLHFFETPRYIQFLKHMNGIYIITHKQKIKAQSGKKLKK